MSLRTSPWPAGIPCWVELSVPEPPAVRGFYADVLGWSFTEPDASFGGYSIAEVQGAAAAGLGELQQPGQPASWLLYFASDDVDATAAGITAHSGTVLVPPVDVGPLGRLAIAVDPTGAAFGVWQAGGHIGAGIVNAPGGLTWDLRSPEPAAARAFYSAVFGHRQDPMPDLPMDYTLFAHPDEPFPLGGMGELLDAPGPHWLVYFGVADASAAVAAATRAGGTVVQQEKDTPYGAMATLADPAGATFAVIQTDGSGQPDRTG